MTDIYIALHSTGQRGRYHWQLVFPTSAGHIGNANVFQVRLDSVWVTAHANNADILSSSESSFVCAVRLPPVSDIKRAHRIAATEDPGQGSTALLWIHSAAGLGWSCAQWVIRVLRIFIAEGIMTSTLTAGAEDNGASFYLQICGVGAKAEDDRDLGQVVDGVRIIPLDA
ncbi:hypothetical protein NEOLEDRAFT_1170195 [Neolentinus lepideus HHB14362 ss-1]|uniref:Uncharacterized protein n=1 Tax=Neolentinus lepideus HHB14362 ss-1 TaxID=1314782 RepID=A0A165RWR7_9AGAM|nr:hypothetical protein NEOLEDRAFT_1170195 [Neolentinus lepideus HHB14362 ss-1]